MSDTEKLFSCRQYDRSKKLVQGVAVLLKMPDEIRSIIGEAVLGLIQQEFEDAMGTKRYRSIGSSKVLSLYKSEKKRRAYDQNPILHKLMMRLYVLSGATQDFVGSHILSMQDFIHRYLISCGELQQEPTVEHVAEITQSYIEKGSEEAEKFVAQLRTEFYLKLFGQIEESTNTEKIKQAIDINSNERGMKVNKLNLE